MLKGKLGYGLVALLLAFAVMLSGCNSKDQAPKDALQASLTSTSELDSYSFEGSLKFTDFSLDLAEMSSDDTMAMNMFKNAAITWKGNYQKDPMLAEVELKLELKGDLAINFTIPIIVSEKKLWVKVPNIPMAPMPEELVGKYLELDLEQLAKEAGQSVPTIDTATSQKFVEDLIKIVFKHLDEKKYLSNIKAKDAGIPDGSGVKEVVQIHVQKSDIEPLIKTVVEKIAPDVLDLIAKNDKYLEFTGLTKEEIDTAKEELKSADTSELHDALADMDKELTKLDLKVNYGIDKNNYPVYTDGTIKAAFDVDGNAGSFALKIVSQLKNVNKKVEFEYGEPDASEVISFQDAFGGLGGLLGGGLSGLEGL